MVVAAHIGLASIKSRCWGYINFTTDDWFDSFCKTGTMTARGISSIAGYLEGGDGHWYIFTIMDDDSPVAEARMYQDRLLKLMMK